MIGLGPAYSFCSIRDPSPPQIDELRRLRVGAWCDRAEVVEGVAQWRGRWDVTAPHRVLLDPQGQIAAALRFSLHDDLTDLPDGGVWTACLDHLPRPLAYFSGMFVVLAWRGRGMSIPLDRASLEEPRPAGAASVVCTTGSVTRDRDRARRMEEFGRTLIGLASAKKSEAIFQSTHLSLVFAARFDGKPANAA